jgi:CheY-like chemotaxis protein
VNTILIVDDERDLREAIAFDFRRKKFRVLLAGSGHEALEIVERENVDVVISDVRMSGGDGVELLERIKARNAFLPVVMFITGFADISLEDAYDKGADAVFAKPFDRKALMEAVQRVILPPEQRWLRQGTRVDAEIAVGVKFLQSAFSAQAKARNIGRGGMFVALEGKLPAPLEKVEFRLEATQEPTLSVTGEGVVRWVRRDASAHPPGCGIEFSSFENESLPRVIGFVNFLKTRSYIPKE